jgi:dTDP-4-amino-4,6-dideoxygalactose transaminase
MEIALKHNIYVIEDAAMAIDSQFVPARNESKFLGGIGHFSAFSFHETKNISCGEGGLLVINDGRFIERAEIIRDKGTNKNCFLKGDAEKYEWVDVGGSFSPNEMTAAFLFAQLEKMEFIQKKRMEVWNEYYKQLSKLKSSLFELPILPEFGQSNGNTFYILCDNKAKRDELIEFMKVKGVKLAFHYNCLHKTKYYAKKNEFLSLPNAEKFSDCLVRLPMYTELKAEEISFVVSGIKEFFGN